MQKCLHFFNTAELNAVGGNLMTGLPFGRLCGRCRFRFVNGRTCKRRTDAYNKYCCDEKIMFFIVIFLSVFITAARNDCRKNLLRRGSSVLPRSEIIAAFWCSFGFCSENHTNRSLPAGILCKGYEPAMLKSVQKIVFRLIYNDKHRMGIDVCNITGSVVASVVFILFRHISKERKR